MKETRTKNQPQQPKHEHVTELDLESWERLQAILKAPSEPTPALKELLQL